MKKSAIIIIGTILGLLIFISSCKKNHIETTKISAPVIQVGQTVTPGDISGSIKGTMTSGNTYNVVGDVTVNAGDTLLLQSGVTVCVKNTSTIIVKGVLISLGTQTAPNWFTACGVNKVNTISQAENQATDPAWNGGLGTWTGIECDTSCALLELKWTHIEFTGAAFPTTKNFVGGTQGSKAKGILFQRTNGNFIMEDSWMYGSIDDAIRVNYGLVSIMRNTFEKCGYVGGDCINVKSGSVGDMAYNLFLGTATNGTKASNKGGNTVQCNINMYNNTYVDGGYRQVQTGRGGDVNYEEGAKGKAYNNLIVNCKFSFRIVGNPVADTINCFYGNNYAYGDSASVCDQFYPVGYITKPNAYIIPVPSSTNYIYNSAGANPYDASALAGSNNPNFLNFPLPEPGIQHLYDINYVGVGAGAYNFRLATGSPALNQGFIGFVPLNATTVTNPNYKAIVTAPGIDIGCYQTNGTGNQH